MIAFTKFASFSKKPKQDSREQRHVTGYLKPVPAKGGRVIGSSDQVHVVDALAITGDEGRDSLRKAVGSWQMSFDPQVSE